MQRLVRLGGGGSLVARWLRVSAAARAALEIKDREMFQKQVIESPDPVIVDFHATYGVRMRKRLIQKICRFFMQFIDALLQLVCTMSVAGPTFGGVIVTEKIPVG